MMELDSRFRDFGICLSLSNLCFLGAWSAAQDRSFDYFRTGAPKGYLLALVLCDVAIMSLALFSSLQLMRSKKWLRPLVEWGLISFLIAPLNYFRTQVLHVSVGRITAVTGKAGLAVLLALAGVLIARQFGRRRATIRRLVVSGLLLLLPLFPVVLVRALWSLYSPAARREFREQPAPGPSLASSGHLGNRVIWMIFDEMDEHLLFERRPRFIAMPEFDRFRNTAVTAVDAYAPGWATLVSLPALLSGRPFTDAKPVNGHDLELGVSGGPSINWFQQATIFQQIQLLGGTAAVAGWYHPYCKLFGSSLVSCLANPGPYPLFTEEHVRIMGFPYMMFSVAMDQLGRHTAVTAIYTSQGSATLGDIRMLGVVRREQLACFRDVYREGMRLTSDPRVNLVFLHWPIPHPIGIFDREKGELSEERNTNYLDNMALADKTLRELRENMERAGQWDSSTIIISSDHPLRRGMWSEQINWPREVLSAILDQGTQSPKYNRIPFLVKFAGQREGTVYDKPFNTVLTHDLVLQILRGDVKTSRDLIGWLDTHRNSVPIQPSPNPADDL